MKVDNEKILITDPVYFIKEEDWRKFCLLPADEIMSSVGLNNCEASTTGIGDWCCDVFELDENDEETKIGGFTADAGLVCIAKLADVLVYNPDFEKKLDDYIKREIAAVIEFDGRCDIEFDDDEFAFVCGNGTKDGKAFAFYTSMEGWDEEDDGEVQ